MKLFTNLPGGSSVVYRRYLKRSIPSASSSDKEVFLAMVGDTTAAVSLASFLDVCGGSVVAIESCRPDLSVGAGAEV